MRADWTVSGECTSGLTAPRRGATRRISGGAATTSTCAESIVGVVNTFLMVVTDLRVGPDGYLYVLTFSGTLYKIVPIVSS